MSLFDFRSWNDVAMMPVDGQVSLTEHDNLHNVCFLYAHLKYGSYYGNASGWRTASSFVYFVFCLVGYLLHALRYFSLTS